MNVKPNNASKDTIISISLPQSLAKEAKKIAQATRRSRSQIFREALKRYFWSRKWEGLQAYGVRRSIDLGLTPNDVERLVDEYRRPKKKTAARR